MTTKEIAEKTGWSYITCYTWASKNLKKEDGRFIWTDDDLQNFKNRESQKNWKPEEIEAVKKHLADGMGFTAISNAMNKDRGALYRMVVKENIMTKEELEKLRIDNRNKELAAGRKKRWT